MHPELLNNSLFLRYYKQWQDNPSSIVFAPVADFFLKYDMIDAAMKVCREGLRRHPDLVSGRIVMAKVHLSRGNWEEAEGELRRVLSIVPENATARQMMENIDLQRVTEREIIENESVGREALPDNTIDHTRNEQWQTITMADIYASQGHNDKARRIYQTILTDDPGNDAARRGLESLST